MSLVTPSVGDKRKAFHALHASGCFMIPNPWDAGSARYLQGLAFKALASTSSGMAWALGQPDNRVRREPVLAHLHQIVEATDLPVNADFESGFDVDAAGVAESVSLAVETGVAGLYRGRHGRPGAAPVRARRSRQPAARRTPGHRPQRRRHASGRPCRSVPVWSTDLQETIARLQAYAQAGADCLYAPGLTTHAQIVSVVKAVAPKPVNLLIGSAASGLKVQSAAALGVRRISLDGALACSAWGGFMRAAQLIAHEGRFDAFADAAPGAKLDQLFGQSPGGELKRHCRERPSASGRLRTGWRQRPWMQRFRATGRKQDRRGRRVTLPSIRTHRSCRRRPLTR